MGLVEDDLYKRPLLEFGDWIDYTQLRWEAILCQKLGPGGVHAAMAAHLPLLASASKQAYVEYCNAWKRRNRKKAT